MLLAMVLIHIAGECQQRRGGLADLPQRYTVLTQLDSLAFPRCHLLAKDCNESSQPI
jgi:hypothetical protein